MSRFLTDKDYNPIIRSYVAKLLTGDNNYTRNDAEDTAIEIVSGYLRSRYDVTKVFKPVTTFVTGEQWAIGDIVIKGNKVYVALVANPGDDVEDEDKWLLSDPRNKAVIMTVIDIALYHLTSNLSPQNIPELRVKRYDDAMKWLDKVQKELISPDLPLLDEDKPSAAYIVGSNTKVTQRW